MRRRVKWTEKKNARSKHRLWFLSSAENDSYNFMRTENENMKNMNLVDDDERQPHGQTSERQRTDGNKYLPRNYSTHTHIQIERRCVALDQPVGRIHSKHTHTPYAKCAYLHGVAIMSRY